MAWRLNAARTSAPPLSVQGKERRKKKGTSGEVAPSASLRFLFDKETAAGEAKLIATISQ